jgi:PST family polysaccharide transporter/stage V sporulation protein B
MLFKNNEGTEAIIAIAAATLFSSIQLTSSAILQGIGVVYIPVRNLFLGALAKLGLNFLLVPILGINGAALATVISYLIATILNLVALYQRTGVVFDLRAMLFRPLFATFFLSVAAYGVVQHLTPYFQSLTADGRIVAALTAMTAMTAAGTVYGIALMVTGAVTRADIAAVPKVGPRLAGFFAKLGMIR